MVTCHNCGATLKYPVELNGQTYGADCAAFLLGTHPSQLIIREGVVDRAAMRDQSEQFVELARQRAAQVAQLEAKKVRHATEYAWLLDVLHRDGSGFALDMVLYITVDGLRSLSPRQLDVCKDIYGKQFGRKGSKAFWAAVDGRAWV